MDAEDFKTLGECEFGTIWEVQSENKVVVNSYQAALYFSKDDFFHFASMVEASLKSLTGKGFSAPSSPKTPEPEDEPASEVAQITDFQAFRKKARKSDDDETE